MTKASAKVAAEIDRLRDEIRYHDRKYYVDASPEITDRDYDALIDALKQLEARSSRTDHQRQPHAAHRR